ITGVEVGNGSIRGRCRWTGARGWRERCPRKRSAMTSAKECFRQAGLLVFERGWLSSNNVLFAGDDSTESVLIDSGYVTHSEQTVELVRQALRGRRLDRVINTHLHSDHCGGNHALQ